MWLFVQVKLWRRRADDAMPAFMTGGVANVDGEPDAASVAHINACLSEALTTSVAPSDTHALVLLAYCRLVASYSVWIATEVRAAIVLLLLFDFPVLSSLMHFLLRSLV